MSSLMLSFVTNDNVVLRYSDTGNGDRWKWDKDPLILVCCEICRVLFRYSIPSVFAFYPCILPLLDILFD